VSCLRGSPRYEQAATIQPIPIALNVLKLMDEISLSSRGPDRSERWILGHWNRARRSREAQMPEWTLNDVRNYARGAAKPIFLYFTTGTAPYYGGQQRLDTLLLHPIVIGIIANRYVFRIFDRARGTGIPAATELGINTINPTLIFLTPQGQVTYRWEIGSYADIAGWSAPALANWLDVYSSVHSQDSDEVFEAAAADTANLELQIEAAQRSWALANHAATRQWLDGVAAADTSTRRGVAARAAWQSLLIQLDEEYRSRGQILAREYLQRFPSHGMPAVSLLAAAGAESNQINAGIVSIVENTVYGKNAGDNDNATCVDINAVVYDALDLGAHDAALIAAEAQVRADPENANAYDTLAQVQAARGAFDEAVSTAREGLRHVDEVSSMADTLRSTVRDAQHRTASGVGGLSIRQVRQSLTIVPGEGKLFYDQLPDSRLRCELKAKISNLLQADDRLPRDTVLRVRMGAGGHITDVEILTAGLSEQMEASLRERVQNLDAIFDTAGLEVIVLASASDRVRSSGCGCR
jgi:tetratricopeptide (TPR) repeat protein